MVDSESEEPSSETSDEHSQNNWSPQKNEQFDNINRTLHSYPMIALYIAHTIRNDSAMGSNVNLDKSPSYVSTVHNFNIRNKLKITDMIKQKRYVFVLFKPVLDLR